VFISPLRYNEELDRWGAPNKTFTVFQFCPELGFDGTRKESLYFNLIEFF
jgi:hypothetical protein